MATSSASRMWAIPPGDDGTIRRTLRRHALTNLLAGGAAFFVSVAAITYPLMNESTAVSGEDVLAEFRATKATASAGSSDGSAAGVPTTETKARRSKKVSATKATAGSAATSRSRTAMDASPRASGSAVGAGGGAQSPSAVASGNQQHASGPTLPAEGVYTWTVEGFERAPGMERDLPREAHRVLTHKSDERWEEHMIFSKQKEMWFDVTMTNSGVVANSSRNKVTIGPMTNDKTVYFDPPMLVSSWPFKVGNTWSGKWDGKSYGTYDAKTFEHTFIEIEGERVEVYASEVVMHMKGEIEGTVITRSWVSPKYNIVVRQYMETDVQSGPGNYYSEWTGTVQSLDPQT